MFNDICDFTQSLAVRCQEKSRHTITVNSTTTTTNASKPLGDRDHNKRHKHPDLDHLQPNTTCLVRYAAGWVDRELS